MSMMDQVSLIKYNLDLFTPRVGEWESILDTAGSYSRCIHESF